MVAVRFTYVLKEFESTASRQALRRDESGMPILTELPFGSFYDPVRYCRIYLLKFSLSLLEYSVVFIFRVHGQYFPKNLSLKMMITMILIHYFLINGQSEQLY
jgi:hypothetical protein